MVLLIMPSDPAMPENNLKEVMDIYLPFPDLARSAKALKDSELLNSCESALRVCRIVHEDRGEHQMPAHDHPLVEMWREHLPWLWFVTQAYLDELVSREVEFPGLVAERTFDRINGLREGLAWQLDLATTAEFEMNPPRWAKDDSMYASYQAALFRLDPDFYGATLPPSNLTVTTSPYRR